MVNVCDITMLLFLALLVECLLFFLLLLLWLSLCLCSLVLLFSFCVCFLGGGRSSCCVPPSLPPSLPRLPFACFTYYHSLFHTPSFSAVRFGCLSGVFLFPPLCVALPVHCCCSSRPLIPIHFRPCAPRSSSLSLSLRNSHPPHPPTFTRTHKEASVEERKICMQSGFVSTTPAHHFLYIYSLSFSLAVDAVAVTAAATLASPIFFLFVPNFIARSPLLFL